MTAQQPIATGQPPTNPPQPDVTKTLYSALATAGLLAYLVVLWWFLPRLAAPSALLVLLVLMVTLTLVAGAAVAFERKRLDAADVEEMAPVVFFACFVVSVVCILAIIAAGSKETVPSFLRPLANLLAHSIATQLLMAVIYAALVGSVFAWGVLFAASGWLVRPGVTAQYPPTITFRNDITTLIQPIGKPGIPVTSILSMQKKRGGSYEYTIRVDDSFKQQDSRGEWITVRREKVCLLEVDKQGKVLSLTEPEKKSP